MKENLVTFEVAKLAKEKGFDIKVEWAWQGNKLVYDSFMKEKVNWNAKDMVHVDCSAPTQALLQKWLREKHKIIIWLIPKIKGDAYTAFYEIKGIVGYTKHTLDFATYEEALEKGLQEGLKLIK